ncbi:hypothetical protein Hanom_Chr03g00211331 [Helianthus anomalus]
MEWSIHLKPFRVNYVSNGQFDPSHNTCCVYDETLPKNGCIQRYFGIYEAITDSEGVDESTQSF